MVERPPSRLHDLGGGCLVTVIGVGTVLAGRQHEIGSLRHMGSGYFPVAAGVVLASVGVLLSLNGLRVRGDGDSGASGPSSFGPADWRGWGAIVGGILAFLLLGARFGLAPAAFACVFISAMGDRTSDFRRALLLAAGVTLFGTFLFAYVLKVRMPVLLDWYL